MESGSGPGGRWFLSASSGQANPLTPTIRFNPLSKPSGFFIGKGNKERVVFFTDRALQWITRYLDLRTDKAEALFATETGEHLKPSGVQAMFQRNTKWAGLEKQVTPHIIRHTTVTNLLRNGCPIGYIKEILGHERLETTCRYYLGMLSRAEAERAHRAYLNLEVSRRQR